MSSSIQSIGDDLDEEVAIETVRSLHTTPSGLLIPPPKDGFGGKTIGMVGGLSLLLSNITGPAAVTLPGLFQQAGWFTPFLLLCVVMVVSSFAATTMVQAMSVVRGNERFRERVELPTLAQIYFPKQRWVFVLTSFLLNFSLTALNVSSIIVCAQTMDLMFVTFGWSGALEFYPKFGFVSATTPGHYTTPFTQANSGYEGFISLGYIVTMVAAVPLGFLNLDDNIFIQVFSALATLALTAIWVGIWAYLGFDTSRVPSVGSQQSQVLGQVIFNFAFVITVPSWVNEMKEGISINKSVWWSTGLCTVVYVITGLFGGWALVLSTGQTLLSAMNALPTENQGVQILGQITAYAYPIITVLSGIPIYSLIVRYNLIDSGLCHKFWANVWGVILPWVISFPFYSGNGLNEVINWTSLLFNGVINFMMPLIFYLRMMQLKHYGLLHKLKLPSKVERKEKAKPGELSSLVHTLSRNDRPADDDLEEDDESAGMLKPLLFPTIVSPKRAWASSPAPSTLDYFSIKPEEPVIQAQDDSRVDYATLTLFDFIDPVESDEELVDLSYFHPYPHRLRRRCPWFSPWIFSLGLLVTIVVLNLLAIVIAILQAAGVTSPD